MAAWHAESSLFNAQLGTAVATAGDVNGDGYSDVVVGAPYWGEGELTSEGRGWVFHGSATGLSPSHAWSKRSRQSSAYYGYSVGTAATPLWMPASRWVTIPWNGWDEEHLRTGGVRLSLPAVFMGWTSGAGAAAGR